MPSKNYKGSPNLCKQGIPEARSPDFSVTAVKCFATLLKLQRRKVEMHRKKYGVIFKHITYFLRRKRNSTGGEYNVDFGNPTRFNKNYIFNKNGSSSPGPKVVSPIRSLLWMYSLLPLSYFFQK